MATQMLQDQREMIQHSYEHCQMKMAKDVLISNMVAK